jgi:hypothetical protein
VAGSMKFFTDEKSFLPKSVVCLRDYNLRKFTSDLIAGFTVGLVALPLAMAFTLSSGTPSHPDYIVPSVFNRDAAKLVAAAVTQAAIDTGVAGRQRLATGKDR